MPLLITRGLGSGPGLITQGFGNIVATPTGAPVYVDPRRPADILLERGIKFANVPKGRSDFIRRAGGSGPAGAGAGFSVGEIFSGVSIFDIANTVQVPMMQPVGGLSVPYDFGRGTFDTGGTLNPSSGGSLGSSGAVAFNGAIKFRFRNYRRSSLPSSVVIGVPTAPPAPQGHILDGDTEALWRFDELLSSDNLVDSTGNGHTVLAFHNPPAINGQIDGARFLSGTSNANGNLDPNLLYFQGLGNASMGSCLSGSWTIEMWINPGYHPASSNLFIYNGLDFSITNSHTIMAELQYDTTTTDGLSGHVLFHQWQNPSTLVAHSSSLTIPSGSWSHIAVSRADEGGNLHTFKIYINGQLDTTYSGIPGIQFPISGSGHFIGMGNYIGASGFGVGVGNPFTGKFDDSRVSRIVRSDAEILGSYQRGHPV